MSALEVIAAKKKAKGTTAPTLTEEAGRRSEEWVRELSFTAGFEPSSGPIKGRARSEKKANGQRDEGAKSRKRGEGSGNKKTSPDKKELIDDDPGSTADSGDSQPSHAAPNISCRGEKR